jgi:hypothetical protein
MATVDDCTAISNAIVFFLNYDPVVSYIGDVTCVPDGGYNAPTIEIEFLNSADADLGASRLNTAMSGGDFLFLSKTPCGSEFYLSVEGTSTDTIYMCDASSFGAYAKTVPQLCCAR